MMYTQIRVGSLPISILFGMGEPVKGMVCFVFHASPTGALIDHMPGEEGIRGEYWPDAIELYDEREQDTSAHLFFYGTFYDYKDDDVLFRWLKQQKLCIEHVQVPPVFQFN